MARKIVIDISHFDSTLNSGGKVRMKDVAAHFGVSLPTVRRLLSERYGDSIVFLRGRKGGIFRNPNQFHTAEADTSSTPTVAV